MADITRRTAKILVNQMLNQYKQVIQDCIDAKTEIPAEALYIVNDYEKNKIGKIIDKILHTEDYFSNYEAADLYNFFDNIRSLLTELDLELPQDVKLVDSILDKEEIRLVNINEKALVNANEKVKFQILKADEKGEEENLSRLRYNVQWSVEKIKDEESETGTEDALEKRKAIFDQKDRSIIFNEAGRYKITSYIYIKDLWGRKELVDIVSYEQVVEENSIQTSPDSWKVYLDKDNHIVKVEYGLDRQKAKIINSKGRLIKEVEMVGKDYDGKGFAKKLLTAAGLEVTSKADLELQNFMLDSGLFYINKEEGWIEKEKYFERMTPKDFLEIQDYKDVTVKAVYDDNKGELTFTYTVGGKTENLFVIKSTNRQMEREYPSKSGNQFDSKKADPSNIYGGYIPGKFPKGTWNITLFKEINDSEYGPYKIRTDAYRYVEAWDYEFDEDLKKKIWKKRIDKDGNVVKIKDEGLLIHGGGYSESNLDNKKGSNKYTDNTLGCIRISNLDVYLIVETLHKYLEMKKLIELKVK